MAQADKLGTTPVLKLAESFNVLTYTSLHPQTLPARAALPGPAAISARCAQPCAASMIAAVVVRPSGGCAGRGMSEG